MARTHPHHPALIWAEGCLSYWELESRIQQAALRLQFLGIGRGDAIGVWSTNTPQWVAIAHATGRLGATLVPLNTRLTDDEIRGLVAQAGCRVILADEERTSRATALGHALGWEEFAGLRPAQGPIAEHVDSQGPHAVLFSSGTTGTPKGVVLNWANQVASARASAAVLGLNRGDRWLLNLPLFHVGGLNVLYRCAMAGATVVLEERFDPDRTHWLIEQRGVTVASFVATTLRRCLELGPLPQILRAALVGGGPVPQGLIDESPQALSTYGLTEACSQVTLVRPTAEQDERRSAGPPLPGTSLRIVDEAGLPRDPGEVGFIEVKGPTVMHGYLDTEATRRFFRDGWLQTGDLGYLDVQGYLHVLCRRVDLIVSGGENIYPAEVEAALLSYPQVAQAAVVGVDDPEWGQVPVALVVARDAAPASDELLAHLNKRLAGYKLPKQIRLVPDMPLLANGKPDRVAIRRLLGS